jgi:hypothetical protein
MPALLCAALFLLLLSPHGVAQIAVFWQPGFPTVASQPVDRATLAAALHPAFFDLEALRSSGALDNTELLVLPYGSAVPTDAWKAIESYLQHGGNLLVLGGQPLHVPVTQTGATFTQDRPQDTYSRALDLLHTYEVPVARDAHFAWRPGYAFESTPKVQADKFFTVEGHLNGLGYMIDPSGLLIAAPVIVIDRASGGRIVCLDFQPTAGYWESQDGVALIRQAARYASQGSTNLYVEMLFSVLRPNETPQITVHLQQSKPAKGKIRVELLAADTVLEEATLPVENAENSLPLPTFQKPLSAGFYKDIFVNFTKMVSGLQSAVRSTPARRSGSMAISSRVEASLSCPSAPTTSPPKKMGGISLVHATRRCGIKISRRWPCTASPWCAPASG